METCVVNLIEPGTKAVVCKNGVFGGRLQAMTERAGGEAVLVEDEWGRAVSPEKVEQALEDNSDTEVLMFVHAETSTGVLSDAETLARIGREHDCLVVADTVTSLGGSPLDVDAWGLDAVYSGTQKCLSCVPGLSPVTFSERAVERVQNRTTPVQSWFLDLGLVVGYWGEGRKRAYHHTAPINSIYALHEALLILHEEGIEQAWARHRRLHEALKAGLEALGLEYVVPPAEQTPQLNMVRVPKGVDEADVRRRLLEEHDLEIGAGLGDLAGDVWRIGLMGHACRPENVRKCVGALEDVLGRSGGLDATEAALEADVAA
jgi:alanine-glyoxylate transaminase/serine-glyoxylate transaminase/serine-pyruvate transaminase